MMEAIGAKRIKGDMGKTILKITLTIVAIVSVLSGCATSPGTQQDAPKSAVRSNTGPTLSGYLDVGAGKSLH